MFSGSSDPSLNCHSCEWRSKQMCASENLHELIMCVFGTLFTTTTTTYDPLAAGETRIRVQCSNTRRAGRPGSLGARSSYKSGKSLVPAIATRRQLYASGLRRCTQTNIKNTRARMQFRTRPAL